MVTVGEDIIEMFWRCSHCGGQNPGVRGPEDESLRCAGCGAQKTSEPWRMPDDLQAAPVVTDPVHRVWAAAGPDWVCGHCRAEERSIHDRCSTCGAARDASATAPTWVAPPPPPPPPPAYPRSPWGPGPGRSASWVSRAAGCFVFAFILLGVCAIGGLLQIELRQGHAAAPRARSLEAVVESVTWSQTESLQASRDQREDGWRSEMPSDAGKPSCVPRAHGFANCRPHRCNPHEVSQECNCTGGDTYACNPHEVSQECNCTGGDTYACNPHEVSQECGCTGGDTYACNTHVETYECRCGNGPSTLCNCRRANCRPNGNGTATCDRVCDQCPGPRRCDTCTRTVSETCQRPRQCRTCSRTEYDTCQRPRRCDTCTHTEHETCQHPRRCDTCTRTDYDTCYDQCPVQDGWCRYTVARWSEVNHQTLTGHDGAPRWPGLRAADARQRVERSGWYTVMLTTPDRRHRWMVNLDDEATFRRLAQRPRLWVTRDPTTGATTVRNAPGANAAAYPVLPVEVRPGRR